MKRFSLIGGAETVLRAADDELLGGDEASHLMEFEAGAMISKSVGVSIRPGVGIGANRDRDWSLGIGLRFLF